MNYQGTVIEESLEDKDILKSIKILSTKVEEVTEKHQTSWIKQWTLHKVEISEDQAGEIAEKISQSLDRAHGGSWYADYKNDAIHYIIFRNKIFKIDRRSKEQYDAATQYGLSLGIPAHQVNFSTSLKP